MTASTLPGCGGDPGRQRFRARILVDPVRGDGNRPTNVWNTFSTQSLLGWALLGQNKYTEAEPLLLAGYEGMMQRENTIPPQGGTRIAEALDRLIDLFTATNKPDDVKKWQAERAKYPEARKSQEPNSNK